MKALIFAGVFGFILFGLYSYHKTNTELVRITKTADRLRQEHDSVSAQLQGMSAAGRVIVKHLIVYVLNFLCILFVVLE